MNVDLNKKFPLKHSAEHSWHLLSNIEAVAVCMPGAEITEVIDENNFKGKVKVKLGPVNMAFDGDIKVESIDAGARQIHLLAEGQDNKGTSKVSMDLTASVADEQNANAMLLGDAKVTVNGKLASFGQRMMAQVSDQVLDQFADNFRDKLATVEPVASAVVSAETDSNADAGDKDALNADNGTAASTPSSESDAAAGGAPSFDTTPAANNEINGLKFAWQTLVGLITGLFKRSKG